MSTITRDLCNYIITHQFIKLQKINRKTSLNVNLVTDVPAKLSVVRHPTDPRGHLVNDFVWPTLLLIWSIKNMKLLEYTCDSSEHTQLNTIIGNWAC